jgi:chorismate dehydratase
MKPLRCGRISYTNDLPIYAAFDEGVLEYPGTLRSEVPATLNALLIGGELDLSPISAYAYAEHPDELVLLPDLCIGAPREVMSVVLVSHQPPSSLGNATIAVTNESATGASLLRVLLERRYGVRATYLQSDDPLRAARAGEPALLIGDRALDARFEFPQNCLYDLGSLWHEWKGEQTVFAVWAAREVACTERAGDVAACMRALTEARAWAHAHPDAVAARAHRMKPRPAGFYEMYYAHLNFTLDAAAKRGLVAYWTELAAIGAIDRVPAALPEPAGVAG